MTEPEDTPTPPHKSPTPKTTGLGAQMSRRMGAGPRRRAPGRPPRTPSPTPGPSSLLQCFSEELVGTMIVLKHR